MALLDFFARLFIIPPNKVTESHRISPHNIDSQNNVELNHLNRVDSGSNQKITGREVKDEPITDSPIIEIDKASQNIMKMLFSLEMITINSATVR